MRRAVSVPSFIRGITPIGSALASCGVLLPDGLHQVRRSGHYPDYCGLQLRSMSG